MLLVLGNKNCSRCDTVKNILNNNNIEYEYKMLDDYSAEEKKNFITMAKQKGQLSLPLILKDNELIDLKEVI